MIALAVRWVLRLQGPRSCIYVYHPSRSLTSHTIDMTLSPNRPQVGWDSFLIFSVTAGEPRCGQIEQDRRALHARAASSGQCQQHTQHRLPQE